MTNPLKIYVLKDNDDLKKLLRRSSILNDAKTCHFDFEPQIDEIIMVATKDNALVGLHSFLVTENIMRHAITWTDKKFRHQGLATRLWTLAIETCLPKKILCLIDTEDGLGLLNSLKALYPSINFEICS